MAAMMKLFGRLCICSLLAVVIAGCNDNVKDVGKGFHSNSLSAPWDGITNNTHFSCYCTDEEFCFSFKVTDTTLALTEPFTGESDVEPEDRVEIFFCPDSKMKEYYCTEMDPAGHILDYKAQYYRIMDYDWDFSTLQVCAEITASNYKVSGSVSLDELRSLGIKPGKKFWMGVFQADFTPEGDVHWFSLVPTNDKTPDFHKPDVLFPCKISTGSAY